MRKEAHIVPTRDLIDHAQSPGCPCKPEPFADMATNPDLVEWFWLHNALDGRENARGEAAFVGWVLLLPEQTPRSILDAAT